VLNPGNMSETPSPVSSTNESQRHHVLAQQSRYHYPGYKSFLPDYSSSGNAGSYINGDWMMPYSQWQGVGENAETSLENRWPHDGSLDPSILSFEEDRLIKRTNTGSVCLDAVKILDGASSHHSAVSRSEQQIQPVNELSPEYDSINPTRLLYDIETRYSFNEYDTLGTVQPAIYSSLPSYPSCGENTYLEGQQVWPDCTSINQAPALVNISYTSSAMPEAIPTNFKLQWPMEDDSITQSHGQLSSAIPVPKRKRASPEPPNKRSRGDEPKKPLSEFVVVFENAPGALSAVKHRRKLDAPVRKAAREVRKAGACHQCRFRKRTVRFQIINHICSRYLYWQVANKFPTSVQRALRVFLV
jgi:hypothetical protein